MKTVVHMLNESGRSLYCTGRGGMYLVGTRDKNKVTCKACLRKLYRKGTYK